MPKFDFADAPAQTPLEVAGNMPQGVDADIAPVKAWLDKMQPKRPRRTKKAPAQPPPAPPPDPVAKNMIYIDPKNTFLGAHAAVGVVPAYMLGFNDADPTRGRPMGVDLTQLSPEEQVAVVERIPPFLRAKLQRRWEGILEAQRRGEY